MGRAPGGVGEAGMGPVLDLISFVVSCVARSCWKPQDASPKTRVLVPSRVLGPWQLAAFPQPVAFLVGWLSQILAHFPVSWGCCEAHDSLGIFQCLPNWKALHQGLDTVTDMVSTCEFKRGVHLVL